MQPHQVKHVLPEYAVVWTLRTGIGVGPHLAGFHLVQNRPVAKPTLGIWIRDRARWKEHTLISLPSNWNHPDPSQDGEVMPILVQNRPVAVRNYSKAVDAIDNAIT